MENSNNLLPRNPHQTVILLVDDDVMVLNIARITLENAGYFVLTAENGQEALLLSRQYPGEIHLLLSDVTMPKLTGVELSKRIAVERPTTRILLMSGTPDEAMAEPRFAFLHKPFTVHRLSAAVKKFLDGPAPSSRVRGPGIASV